MKKALIILMFFMGVSIAPAATIEIPPEDPKCAADEESLCVRSCQSTLLACGPFGHWKDGDFYVMEEWDCNTTTCSWSCVCLKVTP